MAGSGEKAGALQTGQISDGGKGITNLQAILDGHYRSPSGTGLGLVGARRLMRHFKIDSKLREGTIVDLGQHLLARGGELRKPVI
jgi:anti-sigma regulatory factor (Ser/Thr protein kinase)